MESVVATVSGYHGTERFKVIKLITLTGANYVGAMDRSITHLVCWEFEGKKYELARKLGAHIINHCWFEDCLQEGGRLPEGPYTMQSGQEVVPISLNVPAIFEGNAKKGCSFLGGKNADSNHYKAPHAAKGKDINLLCLNWSDSHLLKENYSLGWDTKKGLSISHGARKPRRVLKKIHPSNKNQIGNFEGLGSLCESSSRSSTRSRRRKNFHDDANAEIYAEPIDENNHADKIMESRHIDKLRSQSASSSMEKDSKEKLFKNGGIRRRRVPDYFSNLVKWDNSERWQVLAAEGDSRMVDSMEIEGRTDLCDAVDCEDERRDCDAVSAYSCLDQQAELSCVICWTEFCSLRGVLPCGHRFCYSCIQQWADCMASRGKVSTCPLCKANFTSITKFEEQASSEQKIFSQTIPCSSSKLDIFCLPQNTICPFNASPSDSVCLECKNCEPEDLLLSCHICKARRVHSCCLDPPIIPWTCIHCRDLRMLYQRFR